MYNVMVVDDEIWSIIDIKNTIDFAALGMTCAAEFQDPISAIVRAVQMKPDVIIVDLRMPNISGIEFIRHIREQGLQSEIIILSAFQDFEVAREAIRLGVCGYCLKPIDAQELTMQLQKAREHLNQQQQQEEVVPEDAEDSFGALVRYVDEHFDEKLTITELAPRFFLSPNYCSRLFTQRKHMTYSQYLTKARLAAACKMLGQFGIPMKEVAARVGFSDYFYFSRVFKKEYGISPKDYRRQVRTGGR